MRRLQALGAAGVPDAARTGQVAVVAVVLSCAVFLAGGLAACAWWQYSGATFWLDFWFKELGGPLLVAYAVVEALAAAAIVRLFDPGEPMRTAWQLLRAAACVHAASALFRHFLGKPVAANPLRLWHAPPGWLALCEEFGCVLGGTLYLALLMAGLAAALRVYAPLRLLPVPSAREWTVLCAAAGILVYTLRLIAYWLRQPGVQTSSLWWVGWLTDPLLGALLFLALLVRRAAAPLEGGLLARPWQAYFHATWLTCAGSVSVGLSTAGILSAEAAWPFWLIWHPAAALFALAPLFQLQAMMEGIRLASAGSASPGL
jgi:hypothetical protein